MDPFLPTEATGLEDQLLEPGAPMGGAPAPDAAGPAIDPQFTEEALNKLQADLQRDLDAAVGGKVQIDERIRRYRGYMALDRPPPAYEGAPNHVVPYARAKVKGAMAHLRGALDLDPFYVTNPYTEEAAQNQPVWEVLMERELDRSVSQRQLFLAIEEACITGTGIVQLGITQPFDEPLVFMKAVRLEDFAVAPAGVEDISRVSTFYRFYEPWHIVRRRVTEGEYDDVALERIKAHQQTGPSSYDEEKDGSKAYSFQDDNQLHELWECYFRWGAEDDLGVPHTLWRVIYHKITSTILRVEESPFLDCFDAPPYVPIRPMPRIGYFYGESFLQVLEGVQNVMDFSYNAALAYMQYAISPSVFVDQDSESYELMVKHGIAPGKVTPVRGAPRDQIQVYEPPPPTNAWQLIEAARSLGDDATFHDLQLNGIPTNTVRSATEINQMTNGASKKLADNLSAIDHDLSVAARMYWAMVYEFKVVPRGVMPVFQGSNQYLIAAREMDEDEILDRLLEFAGQSSGVQFQPEETQVLKDALRQQFLTGDQQLFIASARRDDMEWRCNGAQLVSDKAVRASKMERLIAGMLPALQLARQDAAAWHLFKAYLQALDIHNWQDYLPPEPPEQQATPEQFQQFSDQMQGTKQGGGVG